jgi:Zn-dependent protease with chaperone function
VTTRRITRQHQVSTDRIEWKKISDVLPDLFPAAVGPRLPPPGPPAPGGATDATQVPELELQTGPIDDPWGPEPTAEKPQPVPPAQATAAVVLGLAVLAPIAVVGWLAWMFLGSPTGDRAVADAMRPSMVTVQGIHPQRGKTRCLGIIVSRSLCVAPLMAATLDGAKIEVRHKDGETEWHSTRLQTLDPVTGLCVLRADLGGDVTAINLPEEKGWLERRAAVRLLSPDEDRSCHVDDGTFEKLLNEGDPDEMLQVETDDDSDKHDELLGRVVIDKHGQIAGLVVGRLPTGESLCAPSHELRSKKKEAAKLPADHRLDRADLPPESFPPGGAVGGPPVAMPDPGAGMKDAPAPSAGQPPENGPPPAPPGGEQGSPAQKNTERTDDDAAAARQAPGSPSAPAPPRGASRDKSKNGDELLPAVVRTATGVVAEAAETVVPLPELPPDTARELGEKHLDAICKEHRRTRDRVLQRRMRDVADEIFIAADKQPDDYTVTVVEDPEIQAFAFVGGNIVINTGFIDFAAGDMDMIRFVMSHEIGHLVLGHVDMPFRRDLMAGTLVPGAPFVGEQINIAIKNSPFNQADEEAADCFAVDIHRKKRWSIRGGVRFFKKISTREESEDGDSDATVLDGLFSSHPDHERRIDLLNNGCEE